MNKIISKIKQANPWKLAYFTILSILLLALAIVIGRATKTASSSWSTLADSVASATGYDQTTTTISYDTQGNKAASESSQDLSKAHHTWVTFHTEGTQSSPEQISISWDTSYLDTTYNNGTTYIKQTKHSAYVTFIVSGQNHLVKTN